MRFATSILALAASVSAHMKLENPVPFSKDTLQNGPLDPQGADFPCKAQSGGYQISQMNNWKAGETQTVSFIGSAVHGGGSCQFSITTDKEPTKESQWKVIKSVIGGCPANVPGNLPEDASGHGAATFPVTLPKELPDGQYTFAWTWLNKVGNREFYMNCAPIMVSGGGATAQDASASLGQLPDMFVANLPNTTCGTVEGEDFAYPDAGSSVVTGDGAKVGTQLVGGGCAQMTKMGAGAGNLGSPAQPTGGQGDAPSSAAASQPAATSAPASKPAASNPGGVFAPGASSAAEGQQTTLVTKTADAAPAPTSAPAVAPSPSSGPTGTGVADAPSTPSASGVPCTNDGAVVCIGNNQFGICDRGFAVPQALAAGMSCSNGSIVRRSVRRGGRPHFHRRHGSQQI
ncbi:lytic polysaccharide monooxygenase [Zopfia rhizophila CBS 207.26]|uniref:Lytic polysaccharide monooxygenase n=1 Tax=Zopfia rhizophila CBS 207.26 TaxID=1314779 RepID=A0A6A6DLJ1_9PEZI|nr:lytic polysaccharide monooxygenase [Zopfia rhizophila CBS 207.26]